MHKPRGLLIQPPRGDARPLPHWPRRKCLETAHRQAASPGLLSCPPCGVASGALHHPVGAGCCESGRCLASRACPHPVPLPGSLFLLFFHGLVFACWLGGCMRTLLAHCVGPSADEAPGVLLRHKMRLGLVSPPILSWQSVFVLKYLSFHVSTMNHLKASSVDLLGPGCLLTLAASLSRRGSSPSAPRRKLAADSAQVVWRRSSRHGDPGSDLFLALLVYGRASCVTAQAPRVSLCRLLRDPHWHCQTVASPRLPAETRARAAAPGCRRVAPRLCCRACFPGSGASSSPGGCLGKLHARAA